MALFDEIYSALPSKFAPCVGPFSLAAFCDERGIDYAQAVECLAAYALARLSPAQQCAAVSETAERLRPKG